MYCTKNKFSVIKTRADLLTWSTAAVDHCCLGHRGALGPEVHKAFFPKKPDLSFSMLLISLLKKNLSSTVNSVPQSFRTTLPPYFSANAGRTSAWCLRATRVWALTGGWWSSSGSLTHSLWTPKNPSSMISPWKTGWSVSSPMGLSFMRWGRIKDKHYLIVFVAWSFAAADNKKWSWG